MKRVLGSALVLAALAGCGGPTAPAVQVAPKTTIAAQGQEAKGYASGWVGQKSLQLNFFSNSVSGRYGNDSVYLSLFFDNDISGNVGTQSIRLRNWNGQLSGQVGKYSVFATYFNGHVSSYNGARALNATDFGGFFSGWLGQSSLNVSMDRDLTFIQKCGVIAVLLSEMTPGR